MVRSMKEGIEKWIGKIICGDWIEVMSTFPSESIDFVMFSPPYWGLRDYGVDKQIGLEPTYQEYIEKLVLGCREIKRILKKTGSMYIVIGDVYSGGKGNQGGKNPHPKGYKGLDKLPPCPPTGLPPKCLIGIPWRLALALIDDGWILRNDIIWYKPNHMPSSVKDRLTNTYEHVFHFVKSKKYYYNLDMIRVPHSSSAIERAIRELKKRLRTKIKNNKWIRARESKLVKDPLQGLHGKSYAEIDFGDLLEKLTKHDIAVKRIGKFSYTDPLHVKAYHPKGKNPGDFWSIKTRPFPEAHFAVYPVDLCVYPILSSCPPDGVVLDPMCGAGTTMLTCELINHKKWDEFKIYINEEAKKTNWNLKWIGIDVNPEYCKLSEKRLEPYVSQRKLEEFITVERC